MYVSSDVEKTFLGEGIFEAHLTAQVIQSNYAVVRDSVLV